MPKTGGRIKELRKKAKLTQQELGDILGVKKASIQKYESGSVSNLKKDTIELLAKVFEVSPTYIMGWEEYDKTVNLVTLRNEVSFIEKIQECSGYVGVEVYKSWLNLNEEGRRRLLFYAEDLEGNEKYTVQDGQDFLCSI